MISEFTTHEKILFTIKKYAGIHFRELQRKLCIGTGNLEYHLHRLVNEQVIISDKINEKVRYFPSNISVSERQNLAVLRHTKCRLIILELLRHGMLQKNSLNKILCFPNSTTVWYLQKLIDCKVIIRKHEGKRKLYKLQDADTTLAIVRKYKTSFFDKLIDNFIDSWE